MSDSKFQPERVQAPVADGALISDLRRVATVAATDTISFRLYSDLGIYAPHTLAVRFGTRNRALIASGLATSSERNINDERLLENLMRL